MMVWGWWEPDSVPDRPLAFRSQIQVAIIFVPVSGFFISGSTATRIAHLNSHFQA